MPARSISSHNVSAEELRQLFRYDADIGALYWRERRNGRMAAGSRAGYLDENTGYVVVRIHGRTCRVGRVVWCYVTGNWPVEQIDHINGNRSDDRFVNLREASASENQWNKRKPKANTSGFKGVSWCSKRKAWVARIRKYGHLHVLGSFKTELEAAEAYAEAAPKMHREFARVDNGIFG